jgi:hypothetical protein
MRHALIGLLCGLLVLPVRAQMPILPGVLQAQSAVSSMTFGKTTIGGSSNSGASNPICSEYSPSGSGTVTSVSWYGHQTSSGNGQAGIFSDNGSGDPANLLANSSSQTVGTSDTWNTFPLSLSVTSGTEYWLCVSLTSNYAQHYDAGSSSPNQFRYRSGLQNGTFYSTWAGTGGSDNSLAWAMSIYATY